MTLDYGIILSSTTALHALNVPHESTALELSETLENSPSTKPRSSLRRTKGTFFRWTFLPFSTCTISQRPLPRTPRQRQVTKLPFRRHVPQKSNPRESRTSPNRQPTISYTLQHPTLDPSNLSTLATTSKKKIRKFRLLPFFSRFLFSRS